MIQNFKKEGKLVPPEVVVRLLQRSMQASKTKKFLIDGFPRSKENLDAAESIVRLQFLSFSIFSFHGNYFLHKGREDPSPPRTLCRYTL